ncbi:MAG: acyl-CoA dehydrogenase [Actinomycetia bacterium]|nr:acyl-CoA dehydrogenase [Actinomycetes bacterium]
MEFGWSDDARALRRDIQRFLDSSLPDWWGTPGTGLGSIRHSEYSKEFAPKLAARGWLTPHWPREYGGADGEPWQHFILGEELWLRGEPRGPQYMNVNWIGPAIIAFGTESQRNQYLPRIAGGDVLWCQGFSEPEAGTDLASLRTRADRDGDDYVINGQKVWTSYANVADYCFLLARTGSTEDRHRGISVFLVPMDAPGVEVREIDAILEGHAFHELFFTDVRVPESARLGEENAGWDIVRHALAYERVGIPRYCRAAMQLDQLAEWARENGRLTDPAVQEQMAGGRALCEAARLLVYRVVDERAKNTHVSSNVHVARAAMVLAERAVGDLGLAVMGGYAVASPIDSQYVDSVAAGLAAGTYEVQLNLIARTVLELERR